MVQDWAATKYSGSDRSVWFALYRDDGNIDDWTFIDRVERGHFRLILRGTWELAKVVSLYPAPHISQF